MRKKSNSIKYSSEFLTNSILSNKKTTHSETLSSSEKYSSGLWSPSYVNSSKRSYDHNISIPISNIEMKMHIDDITLQANSISYNNPLK